MSSNIVPVSGFSLGNEVGREAAAAPVAAAAGRHGGEGAVFLAQLGERARSLRARRGMTRKAVAEAAGVSERHLANLEYGVGNASALILLQVTQALDCSMAELLGDVTTTNPEWLLIREMLEGRDEATLRRVRVAMGEWLGVAGPGGVGAQARRRRVALVGLRGAGKSALGALLAEDLGVPFVELSRQIEQCAGCSVAEIQALYGQAAYRRYERRALEETIQSYAEVVIATPGGVVSDPATFNQLLAQCTTVWLKADPEDHMRRVLDQGDTRPIAASREAMDDLRAILAGRAAFYAKADVHIDTSAQSQERTFQILRERIRGLLGLPLAE